MRGYLAAVSDRCGPCLQVQDQAVPAGRQDPGHPGFVAADLPFSCAQCIGWHAARFNFPPLAPTNLLAWDLFWKLQDQQRAGGFDLLGLDYSVLPFAFTVYRVPRDQWRLLFEKIVVCNREVAAFRGTRRAQERSTQAADRERAAGRTRLDV